MNATEERYDRYEIRLESDELESRGQQRVLALDAPNADVARQMAKDSEQKIVDFSLEIPTKDVWDLPRHYHAGEPHTGAHVDLARWDAHDSKWARWAADLPYDEAKAANRERVRQMRDSIQLDKRGKVKARRLTARQTARFMADAQKVPYGVVDVRRVDPAEIERQQMVSALAQMTQDPEGWAREVEKLKVDGPVAVVTAALGGLAWQKQIDGSSVTVFSSAAIQNSLHTAYTFNPDTHDFFDDASSTEITGTGYTANGVTAASKASTYDTASDQIRLDYADASWATSTLSATDLVIWVNTAGASSTDPIWGNVDFGATVTTTAGTFLVTWDATGVVVYDIT